MSIHEIVKEINTLKEEKFIPVIVNSLVRFDAMINDLVTVYYRGEIRGEKKMQTVEARGRGQIGSLRSL